MPTDPTLWLRALVPLVLLAGSCGGDHGGSILGGGDGGAAPDDVRFDVTDATGGAADAARGPDAAAPPGDPCGPLSAPPPNAVMVQPADANRLPDLVRNAAPNTTFLLADGIYRLPATVHLSKAGLVLRSASGERARVVLDAAYAVNEAIAISASDCMVADITIEHAVDHPIHAYTLADADVTGIRVHGVHIEDGGEQFIKVNSGNQKNWVDGGIVECSTFLLTPAGRPHIEAVPGGCYTGGIDAHGARGWIVRHNRFEGIHCENGGLAEHAIHFWTGSRDTLVENNLIVDCARGIGFGLGDGGGRTYVPDPYPGIAPIGHFGGIIRNNVIWATTRWYDTGIELDQARGARVHHNTVVSSTPNGGSFFSSIDYRFGNTDVEIRNNLTNRITLRDNANGVLSNNLELAPPSLFVNPAALDFHLLGSASAAIDKGMVVPEAGLDIDGEAHANGAPDVGADEYH